MVISGRLPVHISSCSRKTAKRVTCELEYKLVKFPGDSQYWSSAQQFNTSRDENLVSQLQRLVSKDNKFMSFQHYLCLARRSYGKLSLPPFPTLVVNFAFVSSLSLSVHFPFHLSFFLSVHR